MTMEFFDTCQMQVNTTLAELGWDVGAGGFVNSTPGPFGGTDRYMFINTLTRTLSGNISRLICGMWVYWGGGTFNLIDFRDTTNVQVRAAIDSSGNITVRNGTAGTVHLTTSGLTLVSSGWRFVEFDITFGNSGSVEVWMDAVSGGSNGSCDTTTTANAYITNIQFPHGGSGNLRLSHMYFLNTSGSFNNARLGPVKGYLLNATADGNYTQWTASTGSRFTCIDEGAPNDDTDYISDNTVGHKNSIAITNTVAGIGTIYCFRHYWRVRRDDAGPHTGRAFLRVSGADTVEATETIGANYATFSYQRDVPPGGSALWTASEVDGTELGVEVVT